MVKPLDVFETCNHNGGVEKLLGIPRAVFHEDNFKRCRVKRAFARVCQPETIQPVISMQPGITPRATAPKKCKIYRTTLLINLCRLESKAGMYNVDIDIVNTPSVNFTKLFLT